MPSKDHKTNFFIVGAPKCGTTSLYQWLKAHPDVFMPNKKEPLWFCDDMREKSKELGSEQYFDIWNEDQYLDLFVDADNESAIGEASTWYLYSKVAAENIKQFNPQAKIIIMLRDPVEQIVSSYQYGLSKGDETAESLQEALELEDERQDNSPAGQFPYSYLYTDVASYSKQIKRCQDTFPDNQIKVILLDDLKENPQAVYRDTLSFLEVENANFTPDFSQQNVGAHPRIPWLNTLIKHPNSPIRQVAEILPDAFKHKVRSFANTFLLSSNKKSGAPDEIRAELKGVFRPEVKRVSELIDRDLLKLWEYKDN